MEHNRWMAERLLRNWRYEKILPEFHPHSDDSEDKEAWETYRLEMTNRKVRHLFVPFDDLHSADKAKGKKPVNLIMKYCFGEIKSDFTPLQPRLVKR